MSQFTYQPLESNQIRILRLAPGSKDDLLVGELFVEDIDTKSLKYDALSYMWGDPSPSEFICLSGRSLPMARNLTTALHHLRYVDKPLVIWIDAICVNQEDYVERAAQVHLMRRIFGHANYVRIWIFEPKVDGTSEAVKALRSFLPRNKKAGSSMLGRDPTFWDTVAPIFTNQYWSRAWIQQEVLNARRQILHCMDISIRGAAIARFQRATRARDISAYARSTELGRAWIRHMKPFTRNNSPAAGDILEHKHGVRFWNLRELLNNSNSLEMTNPRDRVYALMHLAEDYKEGGIVVDYSRSILDTVVEATAYIVQSERMLYFLIRASLRVYTNITTEKTEDKPPPTWLPPLWYGLGTVDDHNYNYDFHRNTFKTKCSPHSVSIADRRLRVRGMRLDSVRSSMLLGLETPDVTVRQFWNSSFGLYLQEAGGIGMKKLPFEAMKLLVGCSEDEIQDLVDDLQTLPSPSGSDEGSEEEGSDEESSDEEGSDEYDRDEDESDEENICADDKKMMLLMQPHVAKMLKVFLRLAQNNAYADQQINIDGNVNEALLSDVDIATKVVLHWVFDRFVGRLIIMTESMKLGLIHPCAFKEGDEVWVVMGSRIPILVRPQPSGNYWHVCTADIPSIQELPELQDFSSDKQPGDKVGEWVVDDIELE
ncbi:hypothetical protein CC86DRAFT_386630 [Ophiobolus disseminans]|uniref:Heterokaryon incompatibility domain-containing protein n=1 Tax=Ophiobolus disseminans TaxID=1469910 RepID=A0A6A6ZL66_9PLEO|nr:hypothetical protein CC86DRAFT_386630 [Ophiobolus disseminans]